MFFKKKDELTDEEIIEGIKAEGATEQRVSNYLFDKYAGLVFQGMKKYRLSEEDATDVYADAIISVGLQIKSSKFRGESKVSTYLFKIFYNRCLNKIRDLKAKYIDIVNEMPDLPVAGQSILQSIIEGEEFEKLMGLLDQLGEKCKEIILLREYYGYSMDEIAEKIGFKTSRSVSSMKARCRAELKKIIAAAQGFEWTGGEQTILD